MLFNYLKITWRNLIRNKIHTLINLSGLSIGLACTIIIIMWVQREFSVDQFHENIERLYIIRENQTYSGRDVFTVRATPGPMIPAMKERLPEVERACRMSWGETFLFQINNESFNERGLHADPDFFKMFSFPFLHGDKKTALSRPRTITISEQLAQKYFGEQNPIGQTIQIEGTKEYEVTGVFVDVPDHSTLQFDFVIPMEDYEAENEWLQSWNSNGIQAYLLLKEGVDRQSFEDKIKPFVKDNSTQDNVELFLQAYKDQYLRTDFKHGKYQGGGRIISVKMFIIIACFILLIACINFMNLSTAYAARRAKEVGIRRTVGATRGKLIFQFLSECILLTFISGILALGIVLLVLPAFNQLFSVELSLGTLSLTEWWLVALLLLITGVLAGSYPAFFLSGYRPVQVLKGLVKTSGGAVWLRKGMVIAQFAIATFLILSTLVIYQQMQYLKNKNLGYKKENLIYFSASGPLSEKYDTFKEEVLQQPGVEQVTYSNGYIFSWGSNTSGVSWQGKAPEESILFQRIPVGYDFAKTIGAEILEGRDFSPAFPADSNNYVINQKAAEMMGMEEPVGQLLTVGETEGRIVGLINDFNVTPLYHEMDPVILIQRPWNYVIYMRINSENITKTLEGVKNVYSKHNPEYPFEYSFLDQEYEKIYRSEQRTSSLSKVFAFISIFVSCLGLFGLAAFTTQQRTKEIGVRKILGANVFQLFSLLSREFLILVILGFVVAMPVAWYLLQDWLSDFAYRINMSWWMFLAVCVLASAIALLTVSFQTIKTATQNPVKALRYE